MDSDIVAVLKALNGVVVFSETKAWIFEFLGFLNWLGKKNLMWLLGLFPSKVFCRMDAFICGLD